MKKLNILLFAHSKPTQLLVAVLGSLFGMILVLASLQFYFDIRDALNGGELNRHQYLVINKEVNLLNTLFGGQKGFTQEEIDKFKKIRGVIDAAPLTASQFKVSMEMEDMGMGSIPGLSTELFFEAVPDAFVDVDASSWKWQDGDSTVPVIIPRDYIKLYNFGFAPAQGLPQVTEKLVGLAKFRITIHGRNGAAVFKGRIVGFTDRINTILAPQRFIDRANQLFAGIEPGHTKASRVIIECENSALNELAENFKANGYETGEDSLRNGKFVSFLRLITNIMVVIGGVILILSLLGFFQYAQILLNKSSYELETLIRIGFSHRALAFRYVRFYSFVFLSVLIFSVIILRLLKLFFMNYLAEHGFEVNSGLSGTVLTAGLSFMILFLLVNFLTVMRELRRMAA